MAQALPSPPAVLDSLLDPVLIVGEEGRISFSNQATHLLTGWAPESLQGAPLTELVPLPPPVLLASGVRTEVRCEDGTLLPVEYTSHLTPHGDRTITLRDARRFAAHERDLARQEEELRLQQRINDALQSPRDIDHLLDTAMLALVNMSELQVQSKAGVFLVKDGALHLHATHGEFCASFHEKEAVVPLGSCLCGRAALSGEVIASTNCFTDARHEHTFPKMTAHGHYILPLVAGDEVLGVLFLYTDADIGMDERRLGLFRTLGSQIGMALARHRDLQELQCAMRRLEVLANRDGLTGTLNRRATLQRVREATARSERAQGAMSLIMLDLDHFKKINDQWGHAGGDAVLVEVCRRIEGALRPYDGFGRIGGEEFLVVLDDTDLRLASAIAERIRGVLRADPVSFGDKGISITASLGVAEYRSPEGPMMLLERADTALYRAKRYGRDRVSACPDTTLQVG